MYFALFALSACLLIGSVSATPPTDLLLAMDLLTDAICSEISKHKLSILLLRRGFFTLSTPAVIAAALSLVKLLLPFAPTASTPNTKAVTGGRLSLPFVWGSALVPSLQRIFMSCYPNRDLLNSESLEASVDFLTRLPSTRTRDQKVHVDYLHRLAALAGFIALDEQKVQGARVRLYEGSHKKHNAESGKVVEPVLPAGALLFILPSLKHAGIALKASRGHPLPKPDRAVYFSIRELETMRPNLPPGTTVASFQNGDYSNAKTVGVRGRREGPSERTTRSKARENLGMHWLQRARVAGRMGAARAAKAAKKSK